MKKSITLIVTFAMFFAINGQVAAEDSASEPMEPFSNQDPGMGGNFSWELFDTVNHSTEFVDNATELEQQLIAGAPALATPVYGWISLAIFNTFNEKPDHTYYTLKKYMDDDAHAIYIKTEVYTYSDSGRTNLLKQKTYFDQVSK
ncbi:hypothetical protein [Lentibacillus salicampi]|uniref:DUF3888 domain-containing protein n=1 Tax=Lentibacillus salicampi TaxID=175306 RepID=A0A4Y9ABZ4_9BACI|nr:hypothetical protein [Lentibacillus salicampi]TFJ92945.1 hypothetical protein E4U82_09665 [Lentibacillus salicampi]